MFHVTFHRFIFDTPCISLLDSGLWSLMHFNPRCSFCIYTILGIYQSKFDNCIIFTYCAYMYCNRASDMGHRWFMSSFIVVFSIHPDLYNFIVDTPFPLIISFSILLTFHSFIFDTPASVYWTLECTTCYIIITLHTSHKVNADLV